MAVYVPSDVTVLVLDYGSAYDNGFNSLRHDSGSA